MTKEEKKNILILFIIGFFIGLLSNFVLLVILDIYAD